MVRNIWLDDALLDQYNTVFPLLKKYRVCELGIKVIIGVITGTVGKTHLWTDPYAKIPCMNIEQLKEMMDYGCEIATHSVTHPSFKHLSVEGVTREIKESVRWIKKNLGVFPRVFVPPYNDMPYKEQQAIILKHVSYIRQQYQVAGKLIFTMSSEDGTYYTNRMGKADIIVHMLNDVPEQTLSKRWGKFYFPIEKRRFEINLMRLVVEAERENEARKKLF
jgi:peptidoglycan/xylan/chitin deacetylase (PgdA/CDA1 family)